MPYILLVIALVMNAFANILMKMGASKLGEFGGLSIGDIIMRFATNWAILLGLFLFATNVIFYIFALSKINISIAYPIMTSGGFMIITAFSVLFLKEPLNIWQIIGIVFVAFGITLMAYK